MTSCGRTTFNYNPEIWSSERTNEKIFVFVNGVCLQKQNFIRFYFSDSFRVDPTPPKHGAQ